MVLVRGDAALATSDSAHYLALGGSLLEGHFGTAGEPELLRVPLYPLLLAAGVAAGHPVALAIALQALLGCLVVYAVARAAGMLSADGRLALLAALACAVEPGLLLWGSMLMPDVLLAAAATVALWTWLAYLTGRSLGWLAASMLAACAAAYAKPIAYLFPFWLALLAAVVRGREGTARRWRHAAAAAACAAVVLGAWQLRNLHVAGEAVFSSQLDQMVRVRAAVVERDRMLDPTDGERRALRGRWRVEERGPERSLRAAAVRTVIESPGHALWVEARGMLRTMLNPGVVSWAQFLGLDRSPRQTTLAVTRYQPSAAVAWVWSSQPILLAAAVALWFALLPYFALTAASVWLAGGHERTLRVAILAAAAYFLLLSGGPWGQSRLRVPFMPVLSLLAADGLLALALRRGPSSLAARRFAS